MITDTSPLTIEEYRALRATVRERGTARLIVTSLTFVAWAGLTVMAGAGTANLLISVVPLVALAAGFEVVFALHIGVERIGRFLAVRYEPANGLPAWEHAIADVGARASSGSGLDALFTRLFMFAALLNLTAALAGTARFDDSAAVLAGVLFLVLSHGAFVIRLFRAHRFAASQRARDAELFREHSARTI